VGIRSLAQNVLPLGPVVSRVSVPPWTSVIHFAIGNPNPVPAPLRASSSRTNRSKIRARSASGMPDPPSATRL
jgi:hypothetical protein